MLFNDTARGGGGGIAVLALVSLSTTVYYVLAAITVHIVNRAFDPVRNYVSDCALGPDGNLYIAAYLATVVG